MDCEACLKGFPEQPGLSERDIDVLRELLTHGGKIEDIGKRLYLSKNTVKWHFLQITRTFGCPGTGKRMLLKCLKARQYSLATPVAAVTSAPVHSIPDQNGRFRPRGTYLTDVEGALQRRGRAALFGLPGMGKTQIALEYVHQHAAEYQIAWWLPCADTAMLEAEFLKLGSKLSESGAASHDIPTIRRMLEHRSKWILVFDGALGHEQIESLVPSGQTGHVLVTSQNPNWEVLPAEPIEVWTMELDEAAKWLLERSLDRDENQARSLAVDLGCHPLAVDGAAAYIGEKRISFEGYRRLFREHTLKMMASRGSSGHYPAAVSTALELSLQGVEQESRPASDLLRFLGFFAPYEFPRPVLEDHVDCLPASIASGSDPPVLSLNEALGTLWRYSLIRLGLGSLSVHTLVQTFARETCSADERRRYLMAAVDLLAHYYPTTNVDLTWPTYTDSLLPHAIAVSDFAEEVFV